MLSSEFRLPDVTPAMAEHLARFNLKWFLIPSAEVVPFDEAYVARLYPMRTRHFAQPDYHGYSVQEGLATGHRKHQGRVIGVETTQKPRYHHNNRQYYGTMYGFDATADPLLPYLKQAGFKQATRYEHTYLPLRELGNQVNQAWHSRTLMPRGYRLTICPPAVFNLVGTIFHPEWSATESLELGFYRDEKGNATCYAVGSNEPGDYSYIQRIETESDWTYLGFRIALVPE
ncbi:MAG TPA: hypothetical protein VFZ34_25830 [Blastocatellia bacterium]|nr:hypothetical protein [Blastocatellia bacterium]